MGADDQNLMGADDQNLVENNEPQLPSTPVAKVIYLQSFSQGADSLDVFFCRSTITRSKLVKVTLLMVVFFLYVIIYLFYLFPFLLFFLLIYMLFNSCSCRLEAKYRATSKRYRSRCCSRYSTGCHRACR